MFQGLICIYRYRPRHKGRPDWENWSANDRNGNPSDSLTHLHSITNLISMILIVSSRGNHVLVDILGLPSCVGMVLETMNDGDVQTKYANRSDEEVSSSSLLTSCDMSARTRRGNFL